MSISRNSCSTEILEIHIVADILVESVVNQVVASISMIILWMLAALEETLLK